MRHSRVINHLGRTSSHRKAMLANMATSLILHKRITTTTAKAKALKTFVEPLITKSKEDSTHSRRVVFSYLKDKNAVSELFRDVSPKIGERPGGYTRILKLGNRIGDNAEMCILELVDYNEAMLGGDTTKTKTTRRRRAPRKKEDTVVTEKVTKSSKKSATKASAVEENDTTAIETKKDTGNL
jgi:large subunit ribosomal protein L17